MNAGDGDGLRLAHVRAGRARGFTKENNAALNENGGGGESEIRF